MKSSTKIALAYSATSFAATAIHNLFILYYVDLFFSVYKLDHTWFYVGETVFLVWNSVNDPLIGWCIYYNIINKLIEFDMDSDNAGGLRSILGGTKGSNMGSRRLFAIR
jgi:hypothetical protein